jgi:hypothetical protein
LQDRQPVSNGELPEILVEGNDDAFLKLGTGEDFRILAPGCHGADPDNVMPGRLERADCGCRNVLVGEELHQADSG